MAHFTAPWHTNHQIAPQAGDYFKSCEFLFCETDRLSNAGLQFNWETHQPLTMDLKPLASSSWRAIVDGLIVGVGSDLDTMTKFVRTGRGTWSDHKRRHFLLLQRLGKCQCVSFAADGRYLKHDGAPGNERSINRMRRPRWFFRFRGNKRRLGRGLRLPGCDGLAGRLQMIFGRLRFGGVVEIPIGSSLLRRRRVTP